MKNRKVEEDHTPYPVNVLFALIRRIAYLLPFESCCLLFLAFAEGHYKVWFSTFQSLNVRENE